MKNNKNFLMLILLISIFILPITLANDVDFDSYQKTAISLTHRGTDSDGVGTWGSETNAIQYPISFGSEKYVAIHNNTFIVSQNNVLRLYTFNDTFGVYSNIDSESYGTETLLQNVAFVNGELIVATDKKWYKYDANPSSGLTEICNNNVTGGASFDTTIAINGISCYKDICSLVGSQSDFYIGIFNTTSCISKGYTYPATPNIITINNSFHALTQLDGGSTPNSMELIMIGDEAFGTASGKADIYVFTDIGNGTESPSGRFSIPLHFFTKFDTDGIEKDVSDTHLVTSPIIESYDGGGDLEIFVGIQNLKIFPFGDENLKFRIYDSTGGEVNNFVVSECTTGLTDESQIRFFQPAMTHIDTSFPNALCGGCYINNSANIHLSCFNSRTGVYIDSVSIPTNVSGGKFGYATKPKPNIFSANFRKVNSADTTGNEIYIMGYILNSDLDILTNQLINTLDYTVSISDKPDANYQKDIFITVNHVTGVTTYGTDNLNLAPVIDTFTVNPPNPLCINESGNYILTWTESNNHQTKYRYRCDASTQNFNNFSELSNNYESSIWCTYNSSGLFDIEFNVQDEFNLSVNYSFTVNTKAGSYPVCNVFCADCGETETFIPDDEDEETFIEGTPEDIVGSLSGGLQLLGIKSDGSKMLFYIIICLSIVMFVAWGNEVFGVYTGAIIIILELIWTIYASMGSNVGGLGLIPAWIPLLLIPVIGVIGIYYYNKMFNSSHVGGN